MPKVKLIRMYTAIPNHLGERRRKLKKSMAEMADDSYLKTGTYGAIESGHTLPSPHILSYLCAAFLCDPSDLYDKYMVDLIMASEEL